MFSAIDLSQLRIRCLSSGVLHPTTGPGSSVVHMKCGPGKSFTDPVQKIMSPDVLGGKNQKSNKQEKDSLQNRQEEAHDSQSDEQPANHDTANSLDSRLHLSILQ